ncbi:MAG: GNAT family N-acetyltransferase [Desulfatiglandales bacterium]
MLEDYPKEIILKDGTGLTLRPLEAGDEASLFQMFQDLSDDDRWFSDGDVTDIRTIERWVRHQDLNRAVPILAVLEGRIVAYATLHRKYRGARGHIGKVRILVSAPFREKNLGTWMLFEIMNLAISMGLEILVMELVEDRDAIVIKGAKRLNFFQEALLRDYIKDRQGNDHNLVMMVKRLYLGWKYAEGLTAENPLLVM